MFKAKVLNPPAVYEETITVGSSEVDHNFEVKLSALQKMFQELAGNHCRLMGIGFVDLKAAGKSWVISKLKTSIVRRPKMYEEIILRTWPLKPGKIICERDFEIEDKEGNIIIRSTTMWCIIDNVTRKSIKISEFKHNEPDYVDYRALNFSFPDYYGHKLEEQKCFDSTRVVQLSDLDLNGHMNNTIYVDLVFDVLTKEEYDSYLIEGLYMKYKVEARYGDVITVKKYLIRDLVCVKGFVGSTEIFEAVLDLLTPEEKLQRDLNKKTNTSI